jgi:hypothetical protein
MAAVSWALNQPCYFFSCAFFVTYFVHNVATTVSYDRKEHLEFRTAITHHELGEEFIFYESDQRDLLQTRKQENKLDELKARIS